ncbi:sensor histidine kinase [Halovenus salina]|uniref:histidine kinase n=1 Tax=Halovenus salina TaxID=1510225 RepID=A0ABD5W280_9EURY|nr:histidine kinase N-terminal 7TM domain-containing protein [Halovenus salina]
MSAVAVGTALVASLAVYGEYNASVPVATEFRNLELGCALWGISELSVYLSPSTAPLAELYTLRFLFSGLTAILAIVFVAEYTQSELLTRPSVRRFLWVGFGAAMVLWITNPMDLAYTTLTIESFQGINLVIPTFGPGLVVYFVFVYGFYVATFTILGLFILDATNVYRKQAVLIFVAFFVVVAGTIVFLVGGVPREGVDLGIIFNALGGGAIWVAIYRYEFLAVVPLAKEAIVDTVTDPVLVFGQESRLLYSNAAADAIGVDIEDRNTDAEDLFPGLEAAIANGDVIHLQGGDSTVERERVFEPAAEELVDHHGVERGQVIVMRDVTERYRREQRLDEFASIVSHDLRNPLNIASLHINLADGEDDTEHLDDAEDALDRMEELIDDLLTISQAGYASAETEPTPLAQTARAAWDNVDTGDSSLEIPTNTNLHANRSQVQELFENLFRNAVEHNEPPVTVRIDTHEDGFVVTDDGTGIPEDRRDGIFDPGVSSAEGGTGLGLYIVQQIANAHGWTVSVRESEDSGVEFTFEDADIGVAP